MEPRKFLIAMTSALLLLATATATPTGAGIEQLPDIEIHATVRAREVTIAQQGRASAAVRVEPSAGETVEVERNLPKGQQSYRNLAIELTLEARVADPNGEPGAAASVRSEQPEAGESR